MEGAQVGNLSTFFVLVASCFKLLVCKYLSTAITKSSRTQQCYKTDDWWLPENFCHQKPFKTTGVAGAAAIRADRTRAVLQCAIDGTPNNEAYSSTSSRAAQTVGAGCHGCDVIKSVKCPLMPSPL